MSKTQYHSMNESTISHYVKYDGANYCEGPCSRHMLYETFSSLKELSLLENNKWKKYLKENNKITIMDRHTDKWKIHYASAQAK